MSTVDPKTCKHLHLNRVDEHDPEKYIAVCTACETLFSFKPLQIKVILHNKGESTNVSETRES